MSNSANEARRRTESILAADRLAAATKALEGHLGRGGPVTGAVVQWDFKADAWAIKCDACGIAPRALLVPGAGKPQSQADDFYAQEFLHGVREQHNLEKHPKEVTP
jgi:hypothetical protein